MIGMAMLHLCEPRDAGEQDIQLRLYLVQNSLRADANVTPTPCSPVDHLDLIHKDRTCDGQSLRKYHFERPIPNAVRNRTDHYGGRMLVVQRIGNHQGRAKSGLFMPRLRIEAHAKNVAAPRRLRAAHQNSLPRGGPQSNASCRFCGFIFLTKSWMRNCGACRVRTSLPAAAESATLSPA